jgi:hypothetical protein
VGAGVAGADFAEEAACGGTVAAAAVAGCARSWRAAFSDPSKKMQTPIVMPVLAFIATILDVARNIDLWDRTAPNPVYLARFFVPSASSFFRCSTA